MGICRRRPLTRPSGACCHEQARICLLVAGIKIPAAASSSPPPSRRNYLISVKFVYFQELFLIAAAELLAVSCSSALCVMSGCCCNFVSHVCQGLYPALSEQNGDLLRGDLDMHCRRRGVASASGYCLRWSNACFPVGQLISQTEWSHRISLRIGKLWSFGSDRLSKRFAIGKQQRLVLSFTLFIPLDKPDSANHVHW